MAVELRDIALAQKSCNKRFPLGSPLSPKVTDLASGHIDAMSHDEPVDPLAAGQGDEANAKTAAFFSILGFGASSALLRCGVSILMYGLSEGSERRCLGSQAR